MVKKLIAVFGMTLVFLSAGVRAEERLTYPADRNLDIQIAWVNPIYFKKAPGITLDALESCKIAFRFKENDLPLTYHRSAVGMNGKLVSVVDRFRGNLYEAEFDFRVTTEARILFQFESRVTGKITEFEFFLKADGYREVRCKVF